MKKGFRHKKVRSHVGTLQKDLFFLLCNILAAFVLVQSGALSSLLAATVGLEILGSFVSGIFFTSVLAIAPASIALVELSQRLDPTSVALWGALGALCGDVIMFLFLRDTIVEDLEAAIDHRQHKKIIAFFHLGFMRLLTPVIGALIIASPLPDELGLAMMGLSKTKTIYVVPISFGMNFLGILALVRIAHAL